MSILSIVELLLAVLGVYYLLLRILAGIIYRRIQKEGVEKYSPSPKYTVVESCPICGANTIDIFENYDINTEGEKFLVGYSIGCLHCGLKSPILNSMEQCIDYWNTRSYKKTEEWIDGELEIIYEEVENGKERISSSETDTESTSFETDNL